MNGWIRGQKIISPAIIAFLFCLVVWPGAQIFAATFTASLDRGTITLGESATLSLTFEGGQPQTAPSPPDVPGLQISYVGPSSQFSFINGRVSSTVTHNFIVTPQQAGEFIIPSFMAEVGGQQFRSQPLQLTVLKPNAPSTAEVNSGSQIAFLKFTLPKKEIYAGEVVTAELELYLRQDVQNYGNFQLTALPADGFTVGKMVEGQQERKQIGNAVYTVIPISIALTAIKTGTVNIGPVTARVTIVVASSDQSQDPFFQQFGIRSPFGDSGEQKQVSLATDAKTVQLLPLPADNVPPNFNGAIGDYALTVTAGPTNVAVGDPITVRVQISGRGALDAVNLPDQPAWNNFKTYPPTSKIETSDSLGLEGRKTFEEIVTPQNTDVHELPPFSFSFFDPDQKTYRTLTEPSVQLAVHSGGAAVAPMVAATKSADAENPPPQQDLLPIKEQLGTLAQNGAPLVTRPAFLALQSLPVLAFLAALIWRKRADNLANNPRLRRQRHVQQLVENGLNDLHRLAAENNSDEFFATLFRLLQEQLGERFDCPASAITEIAVDENLAALGATETAPDELRELFQLCNQARYAPVRSSQELAAVTMKFEKVARELQNVKT